MAARAALALHPKSLRQIGEALVFFNELRKRVRTFHGRFVYCGNGDGIEVLAKPIFVRGVSPFNGWHAPCLAGAPCALFIQNHYAKSGSFGFSERTLCVITNLSCGRFVFCWERSEDRNIGKANLRKGRQPLQWKCASHPSMEAALPLPLMAGTPRAWLACLMPALRPIGSGFEIREVGAEFYQFFL